MDEVDHAHFLSALELACEACLKKTGIKLELIIGIDILFVAEKKNQRRNMSCNTQKFKSK